MLRPNQSDACEPCCPWSDGLPPELLDIILRYLTCPADRVYFAAVCRVWRSAAQVHKAAPCQLPCLLLPSLVAPSFLSLHSGATRRLYLPENVGAASLCGSHEGGWVALALDQWEGYVAMNLCSGAMLPLPHRLRIPSTSGWIDTTSEHCMIIHTVTFSGVPSTEGCLAAAHVSSASSIAFWRTGMDRHWIASRRDTDVIEDIIYYKEGFHVLSSTEDVVVYAPNAVSGDPLVMSRTSYLVQERPDYKHHSLLPYTHSMSRYLVESRGKLLMILLLFRPKRRREFRIFEMNLAGGGSKASWVELHALPGRVLLLGRGCSRAYEVSQSDRLEVGNIYYLDYTSFNLSLALSNGSRHSSAYMGGVYDFHKKCNKRTRFPRKFTAECSLPIWFMP